MSTNVTITLQSPYPYGDFATCSVDHRRSFEWQKPLLGIVTVIMLWITGSRGNLQSSKKTRRQVSPCPPIPLSPSTAFVQKA